MKPTIMLDVDGVVADFVTPALAVVASLGGPVLKHDDLAQWDIDQLLPEDKRAGYSRRGDAMAHALEHVRAGVLVVDDDGRIWRTAEHRRGAWQPVERRRAENVGGKGYLRVSLHVPGTGLVQVMAHRLVHKVKIGAIPDGLQTNHKNLDKKDNRPSNLESVTGTENIRHSHANGRTLPWSYATKWRGRDLVSEESKTRARSMRAAGSTIKAIANELGISITHAQRIVAGGSP